MRKPIFQKTVNWY